MAPAVKLATWVPSPELISGYTQGKQKIKSQKLSFNLHMHAMPCSCPSPKTSKWNKKKKRCLRGPGTDTLLPFDAGNPFTAVIYIPYPQFIQCVFSFYAAIAKIWPQKPISNHIWFIVPNTEQKPIFFPFRNPVARLSLAAAVGTVSERFLAFN